MLQGNEGREGKEIAVLPYANNCQGCPFRPQAKGYCPPDPLTKSTKLVVYGESAGEDEARIGHGFVGISGQVLREAEQRAGLEVAWPQLERGPDGRMRAIGLDTTGSEVAHVNTLLCRPPKNKWPGGQVVAECFRRHEDIHKAYLNSGLPIVACGANATRALTGWSPRILTERGSVLPIRSDRSGTNDKWLVSTLHPAYLTRMSGAGGQDHLRPLLALDLIKALKGCEPQVPRVRMTTGANIRWQIEAEGVGDGRVALDIEGQDGHVSLVGLSWNDDEAVVMWWSNETKLLLQELFARPDVTLTLHNAAYDLVELAQVGVPMPKRPWNDTIVMAAVLNQALPLGLQSQVLGHVSGTTAWKRLVDHRRGPQVETDDVTRGLELWGQIRGRLRLPILGTWRQRYGFYNGLDTVWTRRLEQSIRQRLGSRAQSYDRLHRLLQLPLLELGNRGIPVDPARTERLRQDCLGKEEVATGVLDAAGSRILRAARVKAWLQVAKLRRERAEERAEWKAQGGKGRPKFSKAKEMTKARTQLKARQAALDAGFNVDSPMQRIALLESLGLKLIKDRGTKGKTTNEKALEKLKGRLEKGTLKMPKERKARALEVLQALLDGKKFATVRRNFLQRKLEEQEEAPGE